MLRITWSIYRRRLLLSGAAICAVIALFGAFQSIPRPLVTPVPLGNIAAPRLEPTAAIRLAAAAPVIRPAARVSLDPNSGPARPSSDRSLVATRLADEHYAAPALAALQCAAGNVELARDAALDTAAVDLWRATVAEPATELTAVAGNRYAYVAAVPLTFAPGLEPVEVTGAACPFAGMDFSQLNLNGLSAVGVAVFADADLSDGMDDSMVMIVGR